MRPRLLDLFCGAGGAAMGYHRVGFEVVGVDIEPQPRYPFEFICCDALALVQDRFGKCWHFKGYAGPCLGHFDAIHASPPCQAHTAMRTMPNAGNHENLIPETRNLLRRSGQPYVIENVVGARPEMDHPVEICGAALGLRTETHDLARHRLFECSFAVMVPPCAHGARPVIGFYGDHVRDARRLPGENDRRLPDVATDRAGKLAWGREAMGIDWMEWEGLVQAIPPAYTEHIGHYLLTEINARKAVP